MPCLTIIDVTGIQNYIFGSNRLKEIIGGSEIVAQATSTWVYEVLRHEFNFQTNLDDPTKKIEEVNDNIVAELVYAGGGNTVILFKSDVEAKQFTKKYTKKILQDAAGLEVVVAHSDSFEMSAGAVVSDIIDSTFEKLNLKKSNRQLSAPLRGMSLTAQCVSTGGAATSTDKRDGNLIYLSTESKQKLDFAPEAENRLKEEICIEVTDWKGLEIPKDFDDLGRTREEASYIAVVHTDGNGMGERIKKNGQGANNRECIEKIKKFSQEINEANITALQKTISKLLEVIAEDKRNQNNPNRILFDLGINDKGKECFPFRPLIFGGDDLTFVCDGRIALALTAFYFNELKKIKLSDMQEPIYSRAGISIIKTHYPFRRAYDLAEDLAKSAKSRIKKIDEGKHENERKKLFAMDWHIAASGLLGNVVEIRNREYLDGDLCMRPIVLENPSDNDDWRTWDNFLEIITEFQSEKWNERRNKVKQLREVLREGGAAAHDFLTLYRLTKSDKLGLPTDIAETGWTAEPRCVHFDAIEMLDLFYPLEKID